MMQTCSQPPRAVQGATETTRISQVVLSHYLRTSHVDFAVLVPSQTSPRPHVYHLRRQMISMNGKKEKNGLSCTRTRAVKAF